MQLKSENNVLYKSIPLNGVGYSRPPKPLRADAEKSKIWLKLHGKEAISRATNEAISTIMSSLCSDYQDMIYVLMPTIQTSERRSDVRRLMRHLKKIKDDEKAPNKSAKRTLTFNELIEAKQDSSETVPTYLKRISDLHSELEQSGQPISDELLAAIAVKGLSPKYSSVEEEASRNALYASTSPTGESNSGLVIKSLSDVSKACRAIDVTPALQRHRSTYGKLRNYAIKRPWQDDRGRGGRSQGRGRGRRNRSSNERKPICYDCFNNSLPCDHHHKACPRKDKEDQESADERRVHMSKREKKRGKDDESSSESESNGSNEDEPRSVFNVLKKIKKRMKRKSD